MIETKTAAGEKMECGLYVAHKWKVGGGGWMIHVRHGRANVVTHRFEASERLGVKLTWELLRLGLQRVAQLGAPGPEGAFGGADE